MFFNPNTYIYNMFTKQDNKILIYLDFDLQNFEL